VHNPHKRGYSAGGSSSGSAVLLARGEADMVLGGDQGGSIRIPSSFCSIYGMKPTHGLAPYIGIMPIQICVGLGFMISTAAVPGGRTAGSLARAGLGNTYFWIDPPRGFAGVILMQLLPFADPKALSLFDGFENAVYEALT
jgi:CubicO group peptidase (beta-lactamase class C family)